MPRNLVVILLAVPGLKSALLQTARAISVPLRLARLQGFIGFAPDPPDQPETC